ARAPEAASARAQAAEADADARAAAATFAPRAFATTTPGYSSGLPVAVAGRVPSVFGVEVHQTLYDPARRAEALAARARPEALANREAEWDLDRLELAWLTDSPRGEPIQAAEDPLAALPEPAQGDHLAAARAADPELAAFDRQIAALETAARFQKRAWLPTIE